MRDKASSPTPSARKPSRRNSEFRGHLAQAVDAPQRGEEARPERDDGERAEAAGERRRGGAEERSEQAGAEFAELVRAADEEHVDRAHTAAHVLRGSEL